MADINMVSNVLWEDYYKIAWVNILTGEYQFVKILETEEEKPCLEGKTIFDYSKLVVSTGLVPAEDIPQYERCTDKRYVLREVMEKRRRVTVNFRRIIGADQKWVRLEIVLPEGFSEDSPWVVYTWKESDTDTCNVEDAMRMISKCFHKILKVNLTADMCEIVKAYPNEIAQAGYSANFSEWAASPHILDNINPEDKHGFSVFINPERLRKRFTESRECQRFRYRRLYDGEYRWVTLEILPSVEYSDDNQAVMLYVRDIHDEYIAELYHQKALEYFCNFDTLTGLHSRFCYNNFCRSFEEHGGSLAVLFADVNGLKYTNDTKGHEYGDRLITGFAEMLGSHFGVECCYRISGDEFVVLSEDMDESAFRSKAEEFHHRLQLMEVPSASVGTAWSGSVTSVDDLIRHAEELMYADKQQFYKRFPEMKR